MSIVKPTLKEKKQKFLAENNAMIKPVIPKKETKKTGYMFTDVEKKETILCGLESYVDEETGWKQYNASIHDGKKWNTQPIGYLPQSLKTRLENMQLEPETVVKIIYKGKEKSTISGNYFHAFFVEQME